MILLLCLQVAFPPAEAGEPFSGELVEVDAINRRGALRLLGDGSEETYHSKAPHRFALLPYGSVRYHGAPAELRDVPLGTVLHGVFLKPSKDKVYPALSLEDEASRGRRWKVKDVDLKKGKLKAGDRAFDIGPTTRVYKGRGFGELGDVAPGQELAMNWGWAPDWKNGDLHVRELWVDAEAVELAARLQREEHLRYERVRGVPAWIEHVEHQAGGRGVIALTVFGGRDPALFESFKAKRGIRMAAAEPTLRTWWMDHDYKNVQILEAERQPSPPPGSSGLRLKVECAELLEGFRPGRIVRLSAAEWPRIKLPPEERMKSLDDR